MKYKLFIGFFVSIFSNEIIGQEINNSLSIYSNTFIEKVNIPYFPNTYQIISGYPSFAYQKKTKNLFYQFEILPFFYTKTNYTDTIHDNDFIEITGGEKRNHFMTSLGLLSEYSLFAREKISFNLVCDNQIYYDYKRIEPYSSSIIKSYNQIGWALSLGFEFEKRINDNIKITLIPLLRLNELYFIRTYADNPHIPVNLRYSNNNSDVFYPRKYNIKIGIKFKL